MVCVDRTLAGSNSRIVIQTDGFSNKLDVRGLCVNTGQPFINDTLIRKTLVQNCFIYTPVCL